MIGIYGFQNQLNGKWYIGQSIHVEHRQKEHKQEMLSNRSNNKFQNALRKHGWENFSFQVLEECSPEELNQKEVFWIQHYNSYLNGYNSTPGGQEKYFNPQLIYDAWDAGLSNIEIAEKLNIDRHTVYNNLRNYKNYSLHESKIRGGKLAYQSNPVNNSKIYQYDLEGNYLAEWPSRKEIMRTLGFDASAIGKCVSNKRKTAYGFQWKNFYKKEIEPYKGKIGVAQQIKQYDLEGNYIQTFNSIKEAAQAVNGDNSLICRVKDTPNKTAYGYKWKSI